MDDSLRKIERNFLEHGDAENGSKYRAALARSGADPKKVISTLIENTSREIKSVLLEHMVPLPTTEAITFDSSLSLLASYKGHLIQVPMIRLGEAFGSDEVYLTEDGIFSFQPRVCQLVKNSQSGKIEAHVRSLSYPDLASKHEQASNYITYGIIAIEKLQLKK